MGIGPLGGGTTALGDWINTLPGVAPGTGSAAPGAYDLWKQQLLSQTTLQQQQQQSELQKALAQTQAQSAAQVAGIGAGAQTGVAGIQAGGAEKVAQEQGRTALGVAGTQAQAGEQEATTAAEAAKYPATLANQRFQQVFPFFQQQFGNLSGQGTPGGTGSAASGGQPNINVGGLYTPQMIQRQVNQGRAQNDAATASRLRTAGATLAGRGYGANSPLQQALTAQYQGQNLAANAQQETGIRQQAAQQNAQQALSTQTAAESQYAARQQEQIQRQQIAAQRANALIAALGGVL